MTPTDAGPWLEVLGTLGAGLLVVLAGLLAAGAFAAFAALAARLHVAVTAAADDAGNALEARVRSGWVEVRVDGLRRTVTVALAGRAVITRPLRRPTRRSTGTSEDPSEEDRDGAAPRRARTGGWDCRPWRLPAARRAHLTAALRREARALRLVGGGVDGALVLDGRDPARTGTILAALHAIRPHLDVLAADAPFRVTADFNADAPRGRATAHLHVRPVRLVAPAARLAWATARACRTGGRTAPSAAPAGRRRSRPRATPADAP